MYHLLLNYRDIQAYDSMVRLVTALESHPELRVEPADPSTADDPLQHRRPVKVRGAMDCWC